MSLIYSGSKTFFVPTTIFVIYLPLLLLSAGFSSSTNDIRNTSATSDDRIQVKQIYPTKPDGREWYIDMSDPRSDIFITSDKNITKQVNKVVSWHVNETSIRMNVDTHLGCNHGKM